MEAAAGTGPLETAGVGKSPQGKANSSKNALKHGMRAKSVLILPGETQEEYDKVVRGWNDYWQPADYQEEKLVETLIRNDWLHKRGQRWQLETEARVVEESGIDPMDWTAEQRHTMELMQRYKTTAERAFYRAWSALRGLGKDIMREDKDKAQMERRMKELETQLAAQKPSVKSETPLTRAQQTFQGQKSPKKRKKIQTLEQWVEIEVSETGKTVTTQYPSNEILIQNGQKKWPAPELVYRRMHSCMACHMSMRGRRAMSGLASLAGWGFSA